MIACRTINTHRPPRRIWSHLAPFMLLACGIAHAQSSGVPKVTAPNTVCTNETFEVQWSGPDAVGDRITLTIPAAPADEVSISAATSDGSPATLNAPDEPGFYEVRYAEGARANILARQGVRVNDCLSGSGQSGGAAGPSVGAGSSSGGAGNSGATPSAGGGGSMVGSGSRKIVLVTGVQADYDQGAPDYMMDYGFGVFTTEDLCAASDTVGWALGEIVNQIEISAIEAGSPILIHEVERMPGAPTREDIADSMKTARDGFCDREDGKSTIYPFVITYSYCRMTMVTNTSMLDILLPAGGGSGTMTVADYASGEASQVSLRRDIGKAQEVLGKSWSTDVSLTSPSDGGDRIGYATTRYDYEYSGSPGTGLGGPMQNAIKVKNSGTIWVSNEVPGIDIVRSFYQNLTNEVSNADGSLSFFEGLLKNLAGLLREGMPLESTSYTESKIHGGPMMDGLSMQGGSHMIVTGVSLVDTNSAWCTKSLLPPDFPVTDIDQQISEAMSGTSSAEMEQAMQQYNEAMQNMTPEQKQMMEQMGVGSMLDQMMGGGVPGAQPPAANPRAAPGSKGSNMPPPEDLQGGSLTETVQRHLQALGYDVGAADGEMSMETVIAISTFQSEKGMEVTGEVTPQLLGVLSAEVDSRR